MNEQASRSYWAAIDWSDEEHGCLVVDQEGRIQTEFRVANSCEGLAEMTSRFRGFVPLRGVAIESHRGPLLVHLLQEGFPVYPINPKLSHAWRKNDSVAECKSDERDGRVLAQELCVRHERLRVLVPEDGETRKLALLCEDEQSLIQDRTRLVQSLKSTLKQYFPAALQFFGDWTKPTAWAWLKRFPTPERFARASEHTLYKFLKGHRLGITPTWQRRVQERTKALDWPQDVEVREAYEMRVHQLVARLQALQRELDQYRKRIEELFASREDAAVFSSLPGAGPKLAPRLAMVFGAQKDRYDSAAPLRQLAGTAPVTKSSGRTTRVHFRRACRKSWRNTMHLFADSSKKYCAWARAFYEYRRNCGDRHALALRKLADKWIKIIYRMWKEGECYNDKRYLLALARTKSPILAYLTEEAAVENSHKIA
jgi:hypothetical protein